MMAMPSPRSRPMRSNRRSASRLSERGRRLVEDDHAGLGAERLGDLDQLALALGEPFDQRLGRDRESRRRQQFARRGRGAPPVDEADTRDRRVGNPAMNRFSAMVRLLNRFSSWWMKAMPWARRVARPRGR